MQYCSQCGNKIEDGAKFCAKCGTPVAAVSDQQASNVEAVAQPQPMNQTGAPSTKLMGTIDILSTAWQNFSARFNSLVFLSVLGILPLAVISALGAMGESSADNSSELGTAGIIIAVVIGLVFFIGFMFWSIWTQAAVIEGYNSEPGKSVGSLLKSSLPKLSKYFWASVIFSLFTVAGSILFVIPGIIFFFWFMFAPYIAITENLGAIDSVRKSKAYVTGYWWAVFGRIILLGLISIAAVIIIGLISAMFDPIFGEAGTGFIINIITAIVTPISFGWIMAIYGSLRTIKGNVELPAEGHKKYKYAVIAISVVLVLGLAGIIVLASTADTSRSGDDSGQGNMQMIEKSINEQ